MKPTQVSSAVLGMPAPKPTLSPIANCLLCLLSRRSSTSVRFLWGPSVELGIAGVVVVIVRLEPILDVVVKDDVVEDDEAVVDSDGLDPEEDKIEEITGMVIAEDDGVVVIDEMEPEDLDTEESEVEEITGIVILDIDDMTGIVSSEVDDITGIVICDVEDMTGTVISEVDEITGIVTAEDDSVVVIGKVDERTEDMNPEEVDVKGSEV